MGCREWHQWYNMSSLASHLQCIAHASPCHQVPLELHYCMLLLTSLDHGEVDPCLFAHSSSFSPFGHYIRAPSSQPSIGEEREKLLEPGAVVAINDIEG